MGLKSKATNSDFTSYYINKYRVFRKSEGHAINKKYGKTVLKWELFHNSKEKYLNNLNCNLKNIFRYPIFGGPIYGYSNGRWNFSGKGGGFGE